MDEVTVTEADTAVAEPFMGRMDGWYLGKDRFDDLLVQAFARHREQSTQPLIEIIYRLMEAGERAIGVHFAPDDCYATGPLTGNPIADLVACPGCVLLNEIGAARATLQQGAK